MIRLTVLKIPVLISWAAIASIDTSSQALTLADLDSRYRSSKSFQDYQHLKSEVETISSNKPEDVELKWRLARVYFELGNTGRKPAIQKKFFSKCRETGEEVIQINPLSGRGYYFSALCQGKLGNLDGLLSSLFMISSVEDLMKKAVSIEPSLEHGGPHRALGKFYHDLPYLLGGDLEKSIRHLKQAVRWDPLYPDNLYYLAESYLDVNDPIKAAATLREFFKLKLDPEDQAKGKILSSRIQHILGNSSDHAQRTEN